MLTVAQDRLLTLAKRRGKEVAIHLFGQEINPETYAICTADMLLKGDGEEAEHIMYGSTLSDDQHASRQFDFMLSNPPYGKSWKTDAEKMGGKKEILDTRFNTYLEGGEAMQMLPSVRDRCVLRQKYALINSRERTLKSDINLEQSSHVETVCLLVLRNPVTHINIDVDVDEMVQDKRGLATYGQIKDYVLEQSGLKVSSLYIAQVKQKHGIIERENYNKPKFEEARQPQCPPEKEKAITEALKHFGMI